MIDHEKVIAGIERGEAKLRRQHDIQEYLTKKVKECRFPMQQLHIPYGLNRGKIWNEEEDRYLIIMLEKYGYGNEDVYGKIRQEMRHQDEFRFDWFFKSRTNEELKRRCNTLVGLFEKEMTGENDK